MPQLSETAASVGLTSAGGQGITKTRRRKNVSSALSVVVLVGEHTFDFFL